VKLRYQDRLLSIKTPSKELHYNLDEGMLHYIFVLSSHAFTTRGFDGVVEQGKNLVAIDPDQKLDVSSLPKFSFFSEAKNTVGFLVGRAGGSGGSSQTIFLINTSDGTIAKFYLSNMHNPVWLTNTNPPAFVETKTGFYLGPRVLSLGYAARISKVLTFQNGKFQQDEKLEKRLYQERFDNIRVTADDLQEWKKDSLNDIDRDSAVRLLDYVYYGIKSGNPKVVDRLLLQLSQTLNQEIRGSFLFNE